MFCSKCGAQLQDGAQFCIQCGEKTVSNLTPTVAPDTVQDLQSNHGMQTSEIKEYLGHAKTLEVNRYTLQRSINRLQDKINTLGKRKAINMEPAEKGDFSGAFWGILFLGVLASLIIGYACGDIKRDNYYFWEVFLIGSIWISLPAAFIGGIISYTDKKKKREHAYIRSIDEENARAKTEREQKLALTEQQNQLKAEVSNVEKLLDRLYEINVIYPKYRELVPVVTMWEYMDSGRCTELSGVNGAYNLFESESRQDIIISNLGQAISMLAQIRDSQYALYEALQEANYYAERMSNQAEAMLASNRKIERNTEIAAYNAKITAENSTISAYIDFCRL